ncbi:MAG: ATPase, partial [Halothiobacillaceae bacterium]
MGTHFKNICTIDYTLYWLVLFTLIALLSGCLDSVPTTSSTTQPSVARAYSGPVAATADVLAFQTNLWNNLKDDNRCGGCHGTGGQSPSFARDDDVNLAYGEVLALVNLTTPAESRMVIKVAGGHNCWLDSNSACGDVITAYIAAWGSGSSTGAATQIELEAPVIKEVGASKNFTATPPASYSAVHDLLVDYCSNCHVETAATPQAPFFADSDLSASYEAVQSKINLDSPANSRLVVRLRDEFHNCWDPNGSTAVNCAASANLMQTAITTLAESITPTIVDPSLVISKALKLTDGIVASGGSRDHSNIIALYEFKTGSGSTLFDTSGVEPELHLTLAGSEGIDYNWVGGWGVEFIGGKAQGSTTASQKLHDRIKTTNEYSIEAWVVPANVTQEERPIVSYSGG